MAALAAAACGDDNDSPTGPTAPAPTVKTETFEGILTRNGATTHTFSSDLGRVGAQLTSLTPDSAAVVGLSLGTWNGVTCQVTITNDRATQGSTAIGQASGTGNLCVRVFDAAGTVAEPLSYLVTVEHF